jgi:vitamin B12 transporter
MLSMNSVRKAPGERSVLAVACGLVCVALVATTAADVARADEALEPVVVTATRTPTRVSKLVADVTVIEREEVERAAGKSLANILADSGGIQLASKGGLGTTSSVFIRGGDAGHTLLLVNGVRFNSATLGEPNLDDIPLSDIDRIEIVRGPLAAMYGSDASSGVVQVFTKAPAKGFAPNMTMAAGSNRFFRFSAGACGSNEQLDFSVQASTQGTAGISATNPASSSFNPDRDGASQESVSARLGIKLVPGWRVDFDTLASRGISHFDDGVASSGATPDTHSIKRVEVSSLALTGEVLPSWRTLLRLSGSLDNSFTGVANQSWNLGEFATRQTQASWENYFKSPIGQFLVAMEHLRQDIGGSALAYDVSVRDINSAVLGFHGSQGAHDWQMGIREDNNSQYGDQVSGSLAYGYHLNAQWRIGGAMGTSFVAPTFNDLYYPGSGNRNLKPQEGFNREVSIGWDGSDANAKLTVYDNRVRDYIQWAPESPGSWNWIPMNKARVRLSGVTLAGRVGEQLGDWHAYTAGSLDLLRARNLTDDEPLLRRSDVSGRLSAGLERGAMSYELTASSNRGAYDQGSAGLGPVLKGCTIFGASVRYAVNRDWAVALRGDNIGNHRYETAYGYNQPVSQYFVTLSYAPKAN